MFEIKISFEVWKVFKTVQMSLNITLTGPILFKIYFWGKDENKYK